MPDELFVCFNVMCCLEIVRIETVFFLEFRSIQSQVETLKTFNRELIRSFVTTQLLTFPSFLPLEPAQVTQTFERQYRVKKL